MVTATSNSILYPVIQNFPNMVAIKFHKIIKLLTNVWDVNAPLLHTQSPGLEVGPDISNPDYGLRIFLSHSRKVLRYYLQQSKIASHQNSFR